MHSFRLNPNLENLMVDAGIAKTLTSLEKRWRDTIKTAMETSIPTPAIGASLDGCRSARLPADIIQLLRDRFGAHGYERVDMPGHFHTEWA
jgi:6-phosphogluconate dehydrogenase